MSAGPLEAVCLLVGGGLPDTYVDRLYRMLVRHSPRSVRLTCLTDQPRPLLPEIVQHDISGWELFRPDMRKTQYKLRLFDALTPLYPEFWYFDVTLIVKGGLGRMFEFAERRPEPLVIVDDWHHATYNSCVMRIRPSASLQPIYDDYRAGKRYEVKLLGDQDYLSAVVHAHGLGGEVATFPSDEVVSYRGLRKLNRKDPSTARAALDRGAILKFHGTPRPHDLLTLSGRFQDALKAPGHFLRDYGFLAREIHEWWR